MTDRNDDDIWNIPVDEMRGRDGLAPRLAEKKPIDWEMWAVRLFVVFVGVVVVASIIVGLTSANVRPWHADSTSLQASASTSDYGKWTVTDTVNPLNDTPLSAITLEAENNGGAIITPTLTIRCANEKLSAYVNWQDYLGPEEKSHGLDENLRYVTMRFGSAPTTYTEGELSDDETTTFFPHIMPFLIDLREVDRFVAQVTPYHSSPTTLVFDVTGIDNALDPIRKYCIQTPTLR